jgi:hypothetical protein
VLEVFPSFKIAVEMLARTRMRTTDTLQVVHTDTNSTTVSSVLPFVPSVLTACVAATYAVMIYTLKTATAATVAAVNATIVITAD